MASRIGVLAKYGLKDPFAKEEEERVSDMTVAQQTDRGIEQAQQRLGSIGVQPKEAANMKEILLKALEAIDKPRAALWTAAEYGTKGKDALEGLKTGWRGDGEAYSGADLMNDVFGELPEDANGFQKAHRWIGATGAEVIGDPLNLLTTGVGSLLKGIASKGAGAMTREVAEGLAKSAVKNSASSMVGKEASRAVAGTVKAVSGVDAAQDLFKSGVSNFTKKQVTDRAAKMTADLVAKATGKKATEVSAQRLASTLSKYGINDTTGILKTADNTISQASDFEKIVGDNLNSAQKLIAEAEMKNATKLTGRGLSIGTNKHNISLLSEEELIKAGGMIRYGISEIPVVGKVIDSIADWGSKLFNSKYINGVGDGSRELMSRLEKTMRFGREAADERTMDTLSDFTKRVIDVAKKNNIDPDALNRRVSAAIEGFDDLTMPQTVNGVTTKVAIPDAQEIVDDMSKWYKEMGVTEQDIGLINGALREVYLPHMLSGANIRGGKITGKLNVDQPASFARKLGGTLQESDLMYNYHTSSAQAQDDFIQEVYNKLGIITPPPAVVTASQLRKTIDEYVLRTAQKSVKKGVSLEQAMQSVNKKVISDMTGLTQHLDGLDAGFEHSSLKLLLDRSLQHNRVLASKEFLDDVKASFGTSVKNMTGARAMMKSGKDVVISKQSIKHAIAMYGGESGDTLVKLSRIEESLSNLRATVTSKASQNLSGAGKTAQQAAVNAEIESLLVDAFGTISPEQSAIMKKLLSSKDALLRMDLDELSVIFGGGANTLLLDPKIIEAYAFDPGIIAHINRVANKQIDVGMQALTNVFDKFNQAWKPLVTGLRPEYYIRNALGGSMNNFLSLGMRAFNPITQIDARHVLSKSGKVTINGNVFDSKDIYDLATRNGALSGTHAAEYSDTAIQAAMKKAGIAPAPAMSNVNPKTVGQVASNLAEGAKKAYGTVQNTARKGNMVVEGQLRMSNFIGNLELAMEKGLPAEQAGKWAAEQTRKFQFDYNDISNAERTVIRRIMPFYTWMRKNMPLQAEQFLNNPGKYTWYTKWQRNAQEIDGTDTSALPEYMQNSMALQIPGLGTKDKASFLTANLPMQDLNNLSEMGKTVMTGLSPIMKAPMELYNNKNLLTGAPIWKDTDTDEQKTAKILQYFLQQSGAVGTIGKAGAQVLGNQKADGTKPVEALPAYVPGGGVVRNYNVEPAKLQQQKALERALQLQIAQLQSGGETVPTVGELDRVKNFSPQEKMLYEKYGILPKRYKQ